MKTVPMTPEIAEAAIDEFLATIHDKLENATAIAKAAVTCMEAGNRDQAVTIAMDIEQLIYDAKTLLGCTTLIKRSAGG